MADLIAWLDAQERKPFSRVASIDETVEAFDPLKRARWYGEGFGVPARIEEIYDRGQIGQQGRGAGFHRTRKWRFAHDLAKSLVPQMMNKIKYNVQTRHKINYRTAYQLRNSQTGETMTYYTNTNSPWFPKLSKTKEWLKTKEELRLQGEKIDRPDTKWVFEKHLFIDLKVVLDRQPLQIGLGRLPDWIRNKRKVISLDNYNDNLCLFRCIAVHRGKHKRDNSRRTSVCKWCNVV